MLAAVHNPYGFASRSHPPGLSKSELAQSEPSAYDQANRDTVKLGSREASWITDALAVTQFVGSGFLYQEAAKEAAKRQAESPPFSDAPLVKLEDPFLILPGWTTQPEKFDNLVTHLLKDPHNGERAVYLKDGKPYSDKQCSQATEVQASDKIFLAVYDDVLSPPDKTASQIAQAVQTIKGTQGEKVDVLGYSMGGLAVRKMLDQDLETLDQVAFLGTGHQGTRFAALANYVIRRDINFAMNMAGVNATHLPAMEWMMPVDPKNPDYSAKLTELNTNIERQKQNTTEMISIGSSGLATITKPWGGTEGGDGLVHESSLHIDGVPSVVLEGRGNKQHGNLPNDTEAFLELKRFFGWQ